MTFRTCTDRVLVDVFKICGAITRRSGLVQELSVPHEHPHAYDYVQRQPASILALCSGKALSLCLHVRACMLGCHKHSHAIDDVMRQYTPLLSNVQESSHGLSARVGASGVLTSAGVRSASDSLATSMMFWNCVVLVLLLLCGCDNPSRISICTRVCARVCVVPVLVCSHLHSFAWRTAEWRLSQ